MPFASPASRAASIARSTLAFAALFALGQTAGLGGQSSAPVERLRVSDSGRFLETESGEPFLWLGCTPWGMTEWLTREDVDLYLDDRKAKGMTIVQLCLFWGKREDEPLRFPVNPPNAYGHRAFVESDGAPDPTRPAVVEGGSATEPNDYWDHVEYCLDAIERRGMRVAALPMWGRRYVNATHEGFSAQLFDGETIRAYGRFLAKRFSHRPGLIWALGGDVDAEEGGDYKGVYRALAEALIEGAREAGNPRPLMTYHPDAAPGRNSSTWFHEDDWLDFNMIETFEHVDVVAPSIRHDRALRPVKPTVLAEPDYEGGYGRNVRTDALRMRRQGYQAYLAGAAGFTYGGALDAEGNGPLFGPSNNWKPLLDWEGAGDMIHLRRFLEANGWPHWTPRPEAIREGRGSGSLEKLAAEADGRLLVYFPDASACVLDLGAAPSKAAWLDPRSGETLPAPIPSDGRWQPPPGWQDAALTVEL